MELKELVDENEILQIKMEAIYGGISHSCDVSFVRFRCTSEAGVGTMDFFFRRLTLKTCGQRDSVS